MHPRLAAPIRLVSLAALLSLLVSIPANATLSTDARESTWAVGIVGGATDGADIATGHIFGQRYSILADGTVFTAVHLLHDLRGNLSILGQANYLSFGPGYESYRVQHVPVGIGARYSFFKGAAYQGSPYVEVSPAIAWSQWQEPFDRSTHTSLRPALIAGLGVNGRLVGRVKLELGLRYFLTADGDDRRAPGAAVYRTPEGLNQVGALLGIYYAL